MKLHLKPNSIQTSQSFRLDIHVFKTYLPCVLRVLANSRQGYQPGGFPILFDGGFDGFVCVYNYMHYGKAMYCKMVNWP